VLDTGMSILKLQFYLWWDSPADHLCKRED
jgi:hypothetical protein